MFGVAVDIETYAGLELFFWKTQISPEFKDG